MPSERLVDYFVVCGLPPKLVTTAGEVGYFGTNAKYVPGYIDRLPALDTPGNELPSQLPPVNSQLLRTL